MNSQQSVPMEVERFNIHFRVQHVVLFSTFLILSFTGWGLKYYEVNHSYWLIRAFGGAENAGLIHRIAGVTMVTGFTYHVLYMAYMWLKGRVEFFRKETTLIPLPKDAKDMVHNLLFFLGIAKTRPRFGKFNYAQKFDYWAVFWGMFIIGLSGLALTFPIAASNFVPAFMSHWIWELMGVVHSDEALLAIVFILVWHFYNEHLKPEVFPMSWVWLTGKISTEHMKYRHPLEYELLYGKKEEKE